jgi:(p)ppGpp synthase/HD superfamily hydrolase
MNDQAVSPRLTPAFVRAVEYAMEKHGKQTRKGSDIPYLGHLLSVAGLVIDADGSQTQAIAALLHDAAEDQGGEATLVEIREKFGTEVEEIVRDCSDTFQTPKPPWRQRKENYIRHLPDASDEVLLVSLADKLHNARALLRDFRDVGGELWERFNVKDPREHLWYYQELLKVYRDRGSHKGMVEELSDAINALTDAVGVSSTPGTDN